MTVRLPRLLTVVAAFVLVGVAVAPAASADEPAGRLDHVENIDSEVRALFSVPGLAEEVVPDVSTVEVFFDGEPIDASAEVQTDGEAVKRTSILTIDVSNSMKGASFDAAKAAALAYIDTAPDDVYIGLVTFASSVETVQSPTQDHAALRDAIGSLELTLQTHLYDGVLESLDVAGETGQRTILLLSDGRDTGDPDAGDTSLDEVLAVSAGADVRIDAVGLNQELTDESPLTQIAQSTDGEVTSTSDFDKLTEVFASEADDLAKQILVTFDPPAGLDTSEGTLSISVEADGTRYADQAFVTLPDGGKGASLGPVYAPAESSFSLTRPWLLAGLGCLFGGLALLLAFGLTQMTPRSATPMQQQLSLYTVHGMRRTEPARATGEGVDIKGAAVKIADHLAVRGDLEDRIAKKLDAGGLKLKPAEWLLLHTGIAFGLSLGALVLTGNPVAMLIFFIVGAIVPLFYLNFKASRRIKNFNSGLAETLQILAGGLQAGLSLSQAVDTIVKEGSEPIASEFHRAIVEQRLGVQIEDSLETVAERMESIDFKWVVMAIRIQREVGGNLAELLLTVSATLREREYLRRQVQVLSAEGRLSAWILGGLPPFFVTYLTLTRPTYVAPLYHTSLGLVMIGVMITMMTVGVVWLKKAVKVEV
jgi:tight adherence protein B